MIQKHDNVVEFPITLYEEIMKAFIQEDEKDFSHILVQLGFLCGCVCTNTATRMLELYTLENAPKPVEHKFVEVNVTDRFLEKINHTGKIEKIVYSKGTVYIFFK